LFQEAALEAGQTVVIHGAVGTGATRFSSLVRPMSALRPQERGHLVRSVLGADRVVDYRTERFEDAIAEADAVLDLVEAKYKHAFQVPAAAELISVVSQPDQTPTIAPPPRFWLR
jgi:NADPH:quinone reductase-like Zn-dependent oxidoreductase